MSCRSALEARRRGRPGLACLIGIMVVALSTLAGLATANAAADTIVQVLFPDLQARDQFLSDYPETDVRTERRIVRPELRVSAAGLAELQRRGYPMQLLLPEPEESGNVLTPPSHNYIVTSHYTFEAHEDSLGALAARYPALTRAVVIGYSLGNRPIHALKVSDNPQVDEDEPVLLLAATTHADEDVGVDITLTFLRDLLSGYGLDIGATAMVENSEIWVVPLLNPDGWMLLESGTLRDWRKNCHDNNGDQLFDTGDGVDLNRNYSFNWEYGATLPGLPTYRGPFAFSEPEITGLRDLMLEIRPTMALTYHQFGDVVIIPWLWNGRATPDSMTYRAIAGRLAGAITSLAGTPFGWYEDAQTAGFMDEWVYGVQGGFCFTVEITTNGLSTVDQAVSRNQDGIYQAWNELYGPQVTGRVAAAATGEPIEAEIRVLEIDTSQLLPRKNDPVTGRYRRLLVPGNYTLNVSAPGCLAVTMPVEVQGGPTVIDFLLPDSSLGTTAVGPGGPGPGLRLEAHPNPARERLLVGFDPGQAGPVRLDLHDLAGRRVATLMDGVAEAGWSRVEWNGADDSGRLLPTGVYLLRLARPGGSETRRIVWMR